MHLSIFDISCRSLSPFDNSIYEQSDSPQIDTVDLFFCKYILGVNRSATNNLVREELVEYDIKTSVDNSRTIEFCKYITKSENRILQLSFQTDKSLHGFLQYIIYWVHRKLGTDSLATKYTSPITL